MIQVEWSRALAQALEDGDSAVLITQLDERGSSPRSKGAKMLVTQHDQYDTLGGGNLEFQSVEYARSLIRDREQGPVERCYKLNGTLGQCCGGEVRVLFEVFNTRLPKLFLFGAGHIAQALIPILSELPLQVNWIDERDELFTKPITQGVSRIERAPLDVAENLPDDAWVLIITHDHQLDFELVKAILSGGKSQYLGMIGSQTKALKFRQRLAQRDFTEQQIKQLTSPIGLEGLKTKRPMGIAVSVAADLITRLAQAGYDR